MGSDSITVAEYNAALAKAMPERGRNGLQERVRKLALDLGWMFYHVHDSRKSTPGFPDCVLVKGERCIVVELKREGKDPTPAQHQWLIAFDMAGIEALVWRPSDLLDGTIQAVLAAADEKGNDHE